MTRAEQGKARVLRAMRREAMNIAIVLALVGVAFGAVGSEVDEAGHSFAQPEQKGQKGHPDCGAEHDDNGHLEQPVDPDAVPDRHGGDQHSQSNVARRIRDGAGETHEPFESGDVGEGQSARSANDRQNDGDSNFHGADPFSQMPMVPPISAARKAVKP